MILWKDYLELCKPRVVMLMILTSLVGMCLAIKGPVPFGVMIYGNLGIALVAGSAAALNHVADQYIDKLMLRTRSRPLVVGRISTLSSLIFSFILSLVGLLLLWFMVNPLTAVLSFLSLIGYAVCYTLYLKHATPQNIVIGGIAGAAPPLLGWTAVTGSIAPQALLLVLIVYVWTPPHFWALAIHRFEDYAKAAVPMLPNTHDIQFTRLNILLYTLLLFGVTLLPYAISMAGILYLSGAIFANIVFLLHAFRLLQGRDPMQAIRTFRFSIYYLGIIFILLLVDHYM